MPRRRPELKDFATALRNLRDALKIEQGAMASRLGVSQRLLSDWENAYSWPDAKEHLHFAYKLHELAPDWVETFAAYFGLEDHPALAPLLAEEPEPPPPPVVVPAPVVIAAAPVEVAPPPPTREELRAALDSVVREAADTVDVRASDLRRGLHAVLEVLVETGTSLEDARAALGMKAKDRAGAKRGK